MPLVEVPGHTVLAWVAAAVHILPAAAVVRKHRLAGHNHPAVAAGLRQVADPGRSQTAVVLDRNQTVVLRIDPVAEAVLDLHMDSN